MLKIVNQILLFIVEMIMLGSFAYFGFQKGQTVLVKYGFGLGILGVVIALWSYWAAPTSGHRLEMPYLVIFNRNSVFYDLIIVTVRLGQLEGAIPDLRENTVSHLLMFMLNNPNNIESLKSDLPDKHILLGFPGVGGTSNGSQIDYVQIKQQKTTIGEVDGVKSNSIINLKVLFEDAGFRTEISSNMQDWLKTHAIFITCITASIINANGDSVQLARDKTSIHTMVQSIREGFAALEALNISIEPKNLKIIFMKVPMWFSVWYWRKAMRSDLGKLAIAPHARVATEEMKLVARRIHEIVKSSSVSTPTLDFLLSNFIKWP